MISDRFPDHIAIIMDGNSRWARVRGMDTVWGHRAGAERVSEITKTCARGGAKYLSLYAFSSENWKRPESEVNALMEILADFLQKKVLEMKENGVRLLVSGRRDRFRDRINSLLDKSIRETSSGDSLSAILCLDYSGRREILDAAASYDGGDLEAFSRNLNVPEAPDVDLLIRTSGEMRISNFMLWQISYAELYFTDTLWPDFDETELEKAVKSFHRRNRRFGARR